MKRWTWLEGLPTTALKVGCSAVLTLATGAKVVATGWVPPDAWLWFLAGMWGMDTVQFAVKRKTNGIGVQTGAPAPAEA